MIWVKVNEELPILEPVDRVAGEEFIVTIVQGKVLKSIAMRYVRIVTRGKFVERWEWNGRIAPWTPIHWMRLPEPPEM